jgi:predicted SAM-dependent methyltransferase
MPPMAGLVNAFVGMTVEKMPAWHWLRSIVAPVRKSVVPREIYSSSKKLNLGCSIHRLPTYINVDVQERFNPDIVSNASSLSFAADSEYDLVRASHILEHFDLKDCRSVLFEWRRVIKPNGFLIVCVPYFEAWAWRTVLWPRGLALDEKTLKNGWINGLFALDLPPEFRHKVVFTERSLRNLLHECGFQVKARLDFYNEEPYTLGIKDDSCNSFSLNFAAIKR